MGSAHAELSRRHRRAERRQQLLQSRPTDDVSVSTLIYRGKHNIKAGVEFNKREYNDDFQQNPRGTFNFNGLATASGIASALADFLIGVPDGSAIAYGNANKYFREPVYNAYINDDWRVMPILTINAGLRWDYGAPITELFGNLVNLDVSSDFTSVKPVEGSSVSGTNYPAALIRPDRRMIEPLIGATWRPIPASTVVIKAGYGLYPDTSVYQNIVLNMAQQYPLSTSLSVANSTTCQLTLASGFPAAVTANGLNACSKTTPDTFAIDPNFRVGYLQIWQVSVQRDLPFALQATATYRGYRGSHGPQEILPNSYPLGTTNPNPGYPLGFVYETSNGSSTREEGQFQLRRRLRSGFAASLAYTYSKSIDDDAYLGGAGHQTASGGSSQSASLSSPSAAIAQNWLDPQRGALALELRSAPALERDGAIHQRPGTGRRHLAGRLARTSVEGVDGAGQFDLWNRIAGDACLSAHGSGHGFCDRPSGQLTGAPIYSSGSGAGSHLNLSAYAAPPAGQWGTAARNSIAGPDQFTFDTSMSRTFRPHGKWYLDVSVNATNTFNHAAFTGWNTIWNTEQRPVRQAHLDRRHAQPANHVPLEVAMMRKLAIFALLLVPSQARVRSRWARTRTPVRRRTLPSRCSRIWWSKPLR